MDAHLLPRLSASSQRKASAQSLNSNAGSATHSELAVSSTVTTSGARFLGRMSWDSHLLDVSPTEMQDSLRSSSLSPQRRSLAQLLPPAPSLSPTRSLQPPMLASLARSETIVKPQRSSLALNGTTGGFANSNKQVTMSYQESMDEVEKLLDENVRSRYYDRQIKSPQQIAALKQAKAKVKPAVLSGSANPNQRSSFEFAPLQDQLVLAAAAAQDAQDEAEQECDNGGSSMEVSPRSGRNTGDDNENEFDPDRATSTQVRLKYFGAAAKSAYYKTYQELHGKSHLFVEKPHKMLDRQGEFSVSQSSLRTHTANGPGTPGLPLRKTTMLSSIVGIHDSNSDGISDPRTPQSSEDLNRIPTSTFARRRQALQAPVTSLGQASGLSALANMESSPSLHSPRVLFLSSCIATSHPAISILIRKDNCHTFDFSHQGLGDHFIIQFAECLPDLPLVEAINVSDNRLSDNALNALLLALENKPNLARLDISENEIGSKSAKSLRNYIVSSLCTIKTLTLNNADVDDQECTLFMIAFEKNKSVEHLYLRSNRIGQVVSTKAKLKGSGSADKSSASSSSSGPLPTGGESIGAMLNVNLNIATLDLSWNLLKFASASPIGNALQLNYNLKELTLSYNACGDQGAMVFGQTIRINTALEKLNLSYNSIGAKGAMVIASGLAANKGLRELILDGNSIGMESGRALMHASCTRPGVANAICHLSLFECNLTSSVGAAQLKGKQQGGGGDSGKATKEMTLFNPADPTGNYTLDLSDPYENMIAHELLRIATFKAEYCFVKLECSPTTTGSKAPSTKIELSRRPRKKAITPDNRELVLKNRSPVALLFAQIDKDQSGSVDSQELIQALRKYGLNISEERMANLLTEYDYDHNGSLQEDEFQDLFLRCGFAMVDTDHSGSLNGEEIENVLRFVGIQDVTPQKIKRMMAHYDLNSSGEIDEHEFLEFMKAEMFRAGHGDEHQGHGGVDDGQREKNLDEAYEAIALRETSGVIWKIPTTGLLSVEFDRDHEHHQEQSGGASKGDSEDESGRRRSNAFSPSQNVSDAVIAKLVASAQGVSHNNSEQADFLRAVLADSDLFFTASQAEQLLEKQGELKSASRKIAALVRILPQMVNRREAISLVVHLFDLRKQWQERFALRRQLGNMYSVLLGSLTNKYCFDLTSADDRATLKKLALIAQEEKQFSKNRSGRSDTSQHGNWENFRNATIDGKMVLLTSTYIMNALLAPSSNLQLAPKAGATSSAVLQSPAGREDIKRKVEFYFVSTTRPPRGTKTLTRRRFEQLLEVLSEPIADESSASSSSSRRQEINPVSTTSEALEKTRQNALLRWEMLRNSVRKGKQGGITRVPGVFRVKGTLDGVQQKLSQLEMLVSDRWLNSDQAAELIAAFPNAINARARAACIIFGRLVDVENFVQIYDVLVPEDQQECVRRLGWLNIFDPMQPDRQFPPLDLSVRDERELVQILAQLALNEGRHGKSLSTTTQIEKSRDSLDHRRH
ncbi:hypothetical protein Gpo141_00007465 [Globisporangium polare]